MDQNRQKKRKRIAAIILAFAMLLAQFQAAAPGVQAAGTEEKAARTEIVGGNESTGSAPGEAAAEEPIVEEETAEGPIVEEETAEGPVEEEEVVSEEPVIEEETVEEVAAEEEVAAFAVTPRAGGGVYKKLEKLQETYPDGRYWRRVDGVNNVLCDTPCPTHDNLNTCSSYNGGWQCWAFASKIFEEIFGHKPDPWKGKLYDKENVRVGDWVRFSRGVNNSYGHSFIVLSVNGGGWVTAVESNYGTGRCRIRWGRPINMNSTMTVYEKDANGKTISVQAPFAYYCRASNWDAVEWQPDPVPQPPQKPAINPQNLGTDFYAFIRYNVNGTFVESANVRGTYFGEDVYNVQTNNGTPGYAYYDPRKIWHFQYAGEKNNTVPSYIISNAYGTMDVFRGDGNNVNVYKHNGKNNQRWYLDARGGGIFRIAPVYGYEDGEATADFLDVGTLSEKDTLQEVKNIWACRQPGEALAFAQQFRIDIIENYTQPITDFGDDFYATIKFGANLDRFIGTEMRQNGNAFFDNVEVSAATQAEPKNIWHFIKDKSGKIGYKDTYKIVNEYSGRCLDVDNGGVGEGVNIQVCKDNGTSAQRFYIIRSSDGTHVNLMPVYCYRTDDWKQGLVLDVMSGQEAAAGANVQIWRRHQSAEYNRAQAFDIQKLPNYQRPAAPAAPASISIKANRFGTKITWDLVPPVGDFDSIEYDVAILSGDDCVAGKVTAENSVFYTLEECSCAIK